MDKNITRIDLEKINATTVIVRQWRTGWQEGSAPDVKLEVTGSISTMLAGYEREGFTVEMCDGEHGRALRGKTTRVDLVLDGKVWKFKKYPYGWSAKTRPIETRNVDETERDQILQWCRDNKWTVYEWSAGYRAFLGEPKPVRDRAAIMSMRRRAMQEKRDFNVDFAFCL